MADKVINTIFKLRRDNDYNFEKIKTTFIPAAGEPVLVDTADYGLRFKIGNGFSTYEQLDFVDNDNNIILRGYYLNNNFYTSSTYTTELIQGENRVYIDKNTSKVYIWSNNEFKPLTPDATENVAGIMKLYQTHGQNTDGTMSQKTITDGVNSIKLDVDTDDEECLILDLPWVTKVEK